MKSVSLLGSLLASLGLDEKEQSIYLATAQLGKTTPAKVAQRLRRERTSTYKLMIQMAHQGILTMVQEFGSTFFGVIDLKVLVQQFEQKLHYLQHLSDNQSKIVAEYDSLVSAYQFESQIYQYEGLLGLRHAYQEMIDTALDTGIVQCKCFASATFEMQGFQDPESHNLFTEFQKKLADSKVCVASLVGTGMSIMEQCLVSQQFADLAKLPTSNEATQVWVIAHKVFIIIFTHTPHIIRIQSPQLANLMHFIADQIQKTS